jgi:hypothetical protein
MGKKRQTATLVPASSHIKTYSDISVWEKECHITWFSHSASSLHPCGWNFVMVKVQCWDSKICMQYQLYMGHYVALPNTMETRSHYRALQPTRAKITFCWCCGAKLSRSDIGVMLSWFSQLVRNFIICKWLHLTSLAAQKFQDKSGLTGQSVRFNSLVAISLKDNIFPPPG